jgi:RimJ/RimL family protein N-acetyltransferase
VELVIRRARRADKRGVAEAVKTVWGGNDRVPRLFDSWVTHRSGPFFVAEVGGHVVGMGKLTVISPHEAWLEGGRVAPRFRRRGIATALIAHRIAYARDHGYAIARFSTSSDNTPIHKAARRFGFRRAATLWRHDAPPLSGPVPRRARPSDARAVRRLVGPITQILPGWEWRDLRSGELTAAIARGRVFVAGDPVSAAAIVAAGTEPHGTLPVVAVGGRGRAFGELIRGLRALAARRHRKGVSLYVTDSGQRRAAARAGYEPPWSERAYLFEKRLRRPAGSARGPARH